jgi:hypothetical protein
VNVACRGNCAGGSAQANAKPKQITNAETNDTVHFVFMAHSPRL